MNPIFKNIIAVIAGLLCGSLLNGGIIMISASVIPPPNGADVTTMEGLKASMHLFEPKHFLMPFLAHALGTFAGAFLAAKIAASQQMKFALLIGILFLAGGITNVFLLPSPLWFSILDIAGAYIPMAYLAGKIAFSNKES
ncbi:MAG: hypothetical protein B7X86_09955 [Sphingobacteriales bacterium 17-39-43]|uniref:hypothetical protein n=1 Tax=Daejeonella sp. TaxID=2805397 RepID=UPI000BCF536C|nr:hypothetical protein [Daejeonella sp.]OYZ31197.1 MAG: hypothetical protein B7Y24_09895 [Sphingobacteriales bacterium 16-39-50]OZA24076.1 MAG: hypothetical protein B7X86_09955 [Sphingobacteriales bacterium 17-39-43]HQT23249.1 hypothetical protein [Daejeonella sp.]HQT58201.1 hypothetical protein [Daejeonella sp.]